MQLPPGRSAHVRVPATSANLGAGFDCIGIALDLYDEVSATTADTVTVEVSGEGAGQLPTDASHLVVRQIMAGLESLGHSTPGISLRAHNVIPHSRGLGSSASAIVAGLALAWGLARPGKPLDLGWLGDLSSAEEGHPDNACAAVHGGAVLAWTLEERTSVVPLPVHPELAAIAFVPEHEVPTAGARRVLPDAVPRTDAVAELASAALLPQAIGVHPEHLLFATRDYLHQPYRAELMPASAALVARLREASVPAVISGAGPTVLAIGTPAQLGATDAVEAEGFEVRRLAIGRGVELLS